MGRSATHPALWPPRKKLAAAFQAIADPARLRLLSPLASKPEGEACVCGLGEPLELSQSMISLHLNVIYEAGLRGRSRRGTWVSYRVGL